MLTVSRQRSDSAKDSIPSDVGIEMGNLEWHHSRELEELRLEEIRVDFQPGTSSAIPKDRPSSVTPSTQSPEIISSSHSSSRSCSMYSRRRSYAEREPERRSTILASGDDATSQVAPSAEGSCTPSTRGHIPYAERERRSHSTIPDSGDAAAWRAMASPERLENLKPWMGGQPYLFLQPVEGDPWERMKFGVDKYDDELCKGWKDDLDTMLVFTGLFSAAVTAFCIESFSSLSQDPADTTNALLLVISQQLANSTFVPPSTESTVNAFRSTIANVQINVLYFISLTLALSVSSVCILGKQWIREFQRDVAVSACDALRIRQARFDALHAWKLPQILAALPVILQAALILFFAGLLVQLWNVDDHTTASSVTAVFGLTVLMVLVTTVVPAHRSKGLLDKKFTPFRSPQAWLYFVGYQQFLAAVFAVRQLCLKCFTSVTGKKQKGQQRSDQPIQHPAVGSWAGLDIAFITEENAKREPTAIISVHRALRWIYTILGNNSVFKDHALWCLQKEYHPPGLDLSDVGLGSFILSSENRADFGTSWGQVRTELCIRALNEQIKPVEFLNQVLGDIWDDSLFWEQILETFQKLDHSLRSYLFRPALERPRYLVGQQMALVLKRLFLLLPSASGYFQPMPHAVSELISLLVTQTLTLAEDSLWVRHGLIHLALEDIINVIPSAFSHRRSVPLLCTIGRAVIELSPPGMPSIDYTQRFFEALDTCVVEMCTRLPDSLDDLDKRNIQTWRQIWDEWRDGGDSSSHSYVAAEARQSQAQSYIGMESQSSNYLSRGRTDSLHGNETEEEGGGEEESSEEEDDGQATNRPT